MDTLPEYDCKAIDKYFIQHPLDVSSKTKRSGWHRLVITQDKQGREHLECRPLLLMERILARLGLGDLAIRLGYGNANLRDIIKKCPEYNAADLRLKNLVCQYNQKHPIHKIAIKQFPWLKSPHGMKPTTFFIACGEGRIENIRKYYTKAVDLNRIDREGCTALMHAIQNRHPEVARFLIEKGADIAICNQAGKTALCYAARYDLDLFVLLLEKGASLQELTDQQKRELLHKAMVDDRDDVFKTLFVKGLEAPEKMRDFALAIKKLHVATFLISLMETDAIKKELQALPNKAFFIEQKIDAAALFVKELAQRGNTTPEALLDPSLPKEAILEKLKTLS